MKGRLLGLSMAEKGSNSHGVDESVKVERGEEERAREKKEERNFVGPVLRLVVPSLDKLVELFEELRLGPTRETVCWSKHQ